MKIIIIIITFIRNLLTLVDRRYHQLLQLSSLLLSEMCWLTDPPHLDVDCPFFLFLIWFYSSVWEEKAREGEKMQKLERNEKGKTGLILSVAVRVWSHGHRVVKLNTCPLGGWGRSRDPTILSPGWRQVSFRLQKCWSTSSCTWDRFLSPGIVLCEIKY